MADPRFFTNVGPFSLGALADRVKGRIEPPEDAAVDIVDAGPIAIAGAGSITFADSRKYLMSLSQSEARACIVREELLPKLPNAMAALVVEDPYKAYADIAAMFYPGGVEEHSIHPRAIIDPTAEIGTPVVIGAGAVVGRRAIIGSGCRIDANAVIGDAVVIGEKTAVGAGASLSHCLVGDRCLIYPGARIGQDGFGFAINPAGHKKIPQLGRVIIGNGIEIGANTTIDRGAGSDTVIGDGCFIDNQVQIGHNVTIGRGCVLVAQVGIAGSATVGDGVLIAARAGIAGHITVGDGCRIGAAAGVIRDLPPGTSVLGAPAVPVRDFWRQVVALSRLANKKKDD